MKFCRWRSGQINLSSTYIDLDRPANYRRENYVINFGPKRSANYVILPGPDSYLIMKTGIPPSDFPYYVHIYTNINIIISDTYFLSKVHKNDFILHLKQFNMIRAFEVRIGTAKLYNFKFS